MSTPSRLLYAGDSDAPARFADEPYAAHLKMTPHRLQCFSTRPASLDVEKRIPVQADCFGNLAVGQPQGCLCHPELSCR